MPAFCKERNNDYWSPCGIAEIVGKDERSGKLVFTAPAYDRAVLGITHQTLVFKGPHQGPFLRKAVNDSRMAAHILQTGIGRIRLQPAPGSILKFSSADLISSLRSKGTVSDSVAWLSSLLITRYVDLLPKSSE